MSWEQVGTGAQHFSSRFEISGEGLDAGIGLEDGDEDEIDLEGYEEYLEHLKSKAAIRPCSARVVRPTPVESPQFSTTNSVPTRPTRPVSARPRMRSTPRDSLDSCTLNSSKAHSSGMGPRRKRQGENLVHARIRAVYNDVGRSTRPMKQTATKKFNSESNGADMHDEYYRLVDAESELKVAYLQEQQKRVKAVAHVRRLEEILAMKDKKIESLLHAKAVGADRPLSMSRGAAQREIAERDRQFQVLTQKLREKVAQQSQLLSSYEEAMQSLRSSMKSTNLMELEEERSQLYQELRHHQELLDRQRLELDAHQQKLVGLINAEASSKNRIAKLQRENKIIAHEKRKLEQEVAFLKSRVVLLQNHLTLEQRKRTYDREFSESIRKNASTSPTQRMMLAQALEEMKRLVQKETVASIKHEKLKSPNSHSILAHPDMVVRSDYPRHPHSSSTYSNFQDQAKPGSDQLALKTWREEQADCSERKEGLMTAPQSTDQFIQSDEAQPNGIALNQKGIAYSGTNVMQDLHQTETSKSNERARSLTSTRTVTECGQQSNDAYSKPTVTENGVNQITDDELSKMQQQKLADIASVLRLVIDDDVDSELSTDILDDAQNLWSDPRTKKNNSIDDVHSVRSKDQGVQEKKEPPPLPGMAIITMEEILQDGSQDEGQSSQALDDLYPSDFLDTDA